MAGHQFRRASELVAAKFCEDEVYKLPALGSFLFELEDISYSYSRVVGKVATENRLKTSDV
ncbi:hypothetical protein PSEUDO9AZ_10729 [Pseudomonas sp. 9AZ]|nr:hypothetical protein PSEUDO9AZ_10729 [Pseudomonas sp. 9AZ]